MTIYHQKYFQLLTLLTFKEFINFYGKNIVNDSKVIKGVLEFLKWAKSKNISMAVCTNKQEHLAVDLLKKIEIYDYFEYVAGGNTFEYCKPDPRHLTNIIEIMNGDIKKSLMVVDMPFQTYRTKSEALFNAKKLIKLTKCDAVKLEGGKKIVNIVGYLITNKIPVMGHIGILPQSVKGKFRFKGKNKSDKKKLISDAKLLEEVSYAEVIEMALFGAKQIHPRTVEPLVSKKIPMRIRSTFDLENDGTLVTSSPSLSTQNTVKCVSALRNVGLINITGGITFAAPGAAAQIFRVLAEKNINVMMVSSNPSESSISIIVKKLDLDTAVNALEMNLLGKIVKRIDTTPNVSIIAVIGSGMKGTVGVASKVFFAAKKRKVNVMMIAQGSSELNLAFVVKDNDCRSVIQSLHEEFNLTKFS